MVYMLYPHSTKFSMGAPRGKVVRYLNVIGHLSIVLSWICIGIQNAAVASKRDPERHVFSLNARGSQTGNVISSSSHVDPAKVCRNNIPGRFLLRIFKVHEVSQWVIFFPHLRPPSEGLKKLRISCRCKW